MRSPGSACAVGVRGACAPNLARWHFFYSRRASRISLLSSRNTLILFALHAAVLCHACLSSATAVSLAEHVAFVAPCTGGGAAAAAVPYGEDQLAWWFFPSPLAFCRSQTASRSVPPSIPSFHTRYCSATMPNISFQTTSRVMHIAEVGHSMHRVPCVASCLAHQQRAPAVAHAAHHCTALLAPKHCHPLPHINWLCAPREPLTVYRAVRSAPLWQSALELIEADSERLR
jgi:hypothetical protein